MMGKETISLTRIGRGITRDNIIPFLRFVARDFKCFVQMVQQLCDKCGMKRLFSGKIDCDNVYDGLVAELIITVMLSIVNISLIFNLFSIFDYRSCGWNILLVFFSSLATM